jgi:hypothetical protein
MEDDIWIWNVLDFSAFSWMLVEGWHVSSMLLDVFQSRGLGRGSLLV